MIFADTHTHIYLDDFDGDRDEVMARCHQQGVEYLFCPNIDLQSIPAMLQMCDSYPRCYPMIGLHPSEVKGNYHQVLQQIMEEAKKRAYVGVGEIGMDLYWDKTFETEQKKVLHEQLLWAQSMNLPAIIHCRKAFAETWEVLKQLKGTVRGIFHCFAGDVAQAKKVIEKGFLIGIGGTLTYKNSGIQDVVKAIGLEHLVLETDSPFLPPVPYRGQRNASFHIPVIAQQLSNLKKIPLNEVAEGTTNNALSLFNVKNTDNR